MSMVSASLTQRKEKSSASIHKQTHATAEELRLAQIIGSDSHEDAELLKNVEKIIEVTGATEDSARTALYDTNNDTFKAIELILENGKLDQSNEWETAGRKKNKNAQSSVRAVDTFDNEIKSNIPPSTESWEKSNLKGRGRGRSSKNRGKKNELDQLTHNNNKESFISREHQRCERRGRGRGGSSGRGGRQSVRGPRSFGRYNENRGGYGNGPTSYNSNDFSKGFKTYTNSNTTYTNTALGGDDEDWGKLEVGTWSNEDVQKQSEKTNESLNQWGVDSWNEDLQETKVFQSQHVQISPPVSGALPLHSHQASAPQMGERIDLSSLFKKGSSDPGSTYRPPLGNDGIRSQSGVDFNSSGLNQHTTPSVIQQLQQQGQSNSLFSDNEPVGDIESSRLFGAYELSSDTSVTCSATIGRYDARNTESSLSQYTGKLISKNDDGNASELLGSFPEHFTTTEQSGVLDPLSSLPRPAFPSGKLNDNQDVSSSNQNFRNFSQDQQREATEAVKASLGLSVMGGEQVKEVTSPSVILRNERSQINTLSFGAPQPSTIQKQRKKTPATSSKIPASAVEMPGSSSIGYHESSNFDLQFSIDDYVPASTVVEFGSVGNSTAASSITSSQSKLFNNSTSSSASLVNRLAGADLNDPPLFSSRMSTQNSQTPDVDPNAQANTSTSTSEPMHMSQRYLESMKPVESIRGPPGISHPQSLPTSSASDLTPFSGGFKQGADLSSSSSYGAPLQATSGNMPLGVSSNEPPNETSYTMSNEGHSFYSTSSLGKSHEHNVDHSSSAGRNFRSPSPTSTLSNNMQASPLSLIPGTPSKQDISQSTPVGMSSLSSGLTQTHILPQSGGTPSKVTTVSAPINILGSSSSTGSLGGSGAYGAMNMGYTPSMPAQQPSSSLPASPGKHLSSSDLYSSTGLSSSLHYSQQPSSSAASTSPGSGLGSSVLPMASTGSSRSSLASSMSKSGPPNLTLGVPPLLPNQYGIPMGPGLMTAYTPEAALYGYPDPLMAVQSRLHQMPNYYDMYATNNPVANSSTANRQSNSSTTALQAGKLNRGEQPSSTSMIRSSGSLNMPSQQQPAHAQRNTQLKDSQTGSHQTQPFMNLPAASPYQGYGGLYYNAYQYPPMFAAPPAVQNAPKHQLNTTATFQQPATGFANAYSTASMNAASSTSNLYDIQGQGYNKGHAPHFEKQATSFQHHTNTPPPAFNVQTLTAAMAAASTGGGAGQGMNPYTQAPFMTMLPAHQHPQLHMPQHGDVNQSVGSQRAQTSNPMPKSTAKAPFGYNSALYWEN